MRSVRSALPAGPEGSQREGESDDYPCSQDHGAPLQHVGAAGLNDLLELVGKEDRPHSCREPPKREDAGNDAQPFRYRAKLDEDARDEHQTKEWQVEHCRGGFGAPRDPRNRNAEDSGSDDPQDEDPREGEPASGIGR